MNDFTIIMWVIISLMWGLENLIINKNYIQGIVWILLLISLCIEFVNKTCNKQELLNSLGKKQ